jgi:trans-2,3-dihydro-3-hydroxyanthranilate isomerase
MSIMPRFGFHLVEVFARTPLSGNLLPVIHNANALDSSAMSTLARRFLQPETSFLMNPDAPGCSYIHRIFTVCDEIPFAGHPSLGAAAAHARLIGVSSGEFIQRTPSGLHRLVVEPDDDGARVSIIQEGATFGQTIPPARTLAALGLSPEEGHPELPAQIMSTGLPALILPLREVSALRSASLDRGKLRQALSLFSEPELLNCYLVAQRNSSRWQARCFALDFITGEDPATGSAAAAFGAYIHHYIGQDKLVIDQGIEMGSASEIFVEMRSGITLSGHVRVIGEGKLEYRHL